MEDSYYLKKLKEVQNIMYYKESPVTEPIIAAKNPARMVKAKKAMAMAIIEQINPALAMPAPLLVLLMAPKIIPNTTMQLMSTYVSFSKLILEIV